MTTPVGTISVGDVATELGQPLGPDFGLDRVDVRALSGASLTPGTPINMNQLRGKTCETKSVTLGIDGSGSAIGYINPALGGTPQGAMGPDNIMLGAPVGQLLAFPAGGGFRLLYNTAPLGVPFKLLIRTTTAAVAGSLPNYVLDSVAANYTPGPSFWVWNWTSGLPAGVWSTLVGQVVNIQLTRA